MCFTIEHINAKHRRNSELYKALMNREDDRRVIELCRRLADHALHIMTLQHDSVLHLAITFKRRDLVLKLIDELPPHLLDKITRQNILGNTVLHEIAVSDDTLHVAEKLLNKAPGLLGMRNNNGETALFRAALYGTAEIFKFLDGKLSGYDPDNKQPFLERNDKSTILHVSVIARQFDLALQIANDYKNLIEQKDMDGMTALQLLSCKPEAFSCQSECDFFDKLINSWKSMCFLAWRENARNEEQKYASAMKLAKCLIEMDTSWESTGPVQYNIRPKIHRYGASPTVLAIEKEIMNQGKGERNDAEIPLFLAVKSGCREIVEETFKTYPQAVGHIDDSGRTIIHVAIKYRQQKIFEFVVKEMEAVMPFLVRKMDNDGNTILHMVGIKKPDYAPEKMEGPALILQEELLWFEQVKNVIISIPQFLDHQNNMGLTAEALFAAANKDLRISSKEWLKRTAEGCSIVAVLIATVAFAAAYTIPGGPNQNTGFPVLMNHPFFTVFTISDILSLTFSLASVVTFLSILTSPFRLQDFKHSLPNKMTLGFTFLFLSVSMMMIAFGATVLLMIKKKESWEQVMLYSFSFIPVGVFGLSYFPLYIRKSTSRALEYLTRKTKQLIPECFLVLLTKLYAFFCTCACTTPSASHSIP